MCPVGWPERDYAFIKAESTHNVCIFSLDIRSYASALKMHKLQVLDLDSTVDVLHILQFTVEHIYCIDVLHK